MKFNIQDRVVLDEMVDTFTAEMHKNQDDAELMDKRPIITREYWLQMIQEVQRKFFGTLYNTYQFFVLYANVDGFKFEQAYIPVKDRPEIDRWVISSLNSLVQTVTVAMDDFEPTIAGRAIETFVDEHLSNWYVRLNRRRFWKGEMSDDKQAAYETLHQCLMTVAKLMSPVSPFFSD